jgi:hypothetical protein
MARYSPEQLLKLYKDGFSGCLWEPHVFDHLMETSKYGYFSDGSKKIKNSGKGKLSTPYKSVLKFDKNPYNERQVTGDCVSHGTRNAVDVSRAVEIDVHRDREAWVARGATEAIYGARGGSFQGMSCARAATFVSKDGGVLVRKNYAGIVDLTKYQGMLGAGWGGRGLPDKVIDLANNHQIKTVSLIRTVEEARDALANGYVINVCSYFGFNSKRDNKGFSKVSGSWAHSMAWIACDDTNSEPTFLVQNSWGCYSDDTEVLTKEGWKLFKNLTDTDLLATLNPNNHYLEWQQIQQKFEYEYNGYLNHYHFRGVDLLVTDNHNMYVGKLHSDLDKTDSWQLIESKNCPKYIHIKKNTKWKGEEIETMKIGQHIISMDLWLEFLGYFISEGHTCNHKKVMSKEELFDWAARTEAKLIVMAGAGDIDTCILKVQEILTKK